MNSGVIDDTPFLERHVVCIVYIHTGRYEGGAQLRVRDTETGNRKTRQAQEITALSFCYFVLF